MVSDKVSVLPYTDRRDNINYVFLDEFGNEESFFLYEKGKDDILPKDLNSDTLYCVHYEKNLDIILRIDEVQEFDIGD